MNIPDFIWLSGSFGVYTGPRANSVCYKRFKEPEQSPQTEQAEASNLSAGLCVTKLTKKYTNDLAKAKRCANTGKAHHWPTIAEILAVEIDRLENILSTNT